jgi:hypothetical protein
MLKHPQSATRKILLPREKRFSKEMNYKPRGIFLWWLN